MSLAQVNLYFPRHGLFHVIHSSAVDDVSIRGLLGQRGLLGLFTLISNIKEERPNVQFFGVSCELYKSTCDEFDVKRYPKILAFPESNNNNNNNDGRITKDDGIEVPKGTGTIYFVSARIMKALRTKEEIEMDRVDPAKFVDGI